MKIKYIVLSTLIAASPQVFAKASDWGTVQERQCVNIKEELQNDILVSITRSITDTRGRKSMSEDFSVAKGQSGVFCTDEVFRGEIHMHGNVNLGWKIIDPADATHVYASFNTTALFYGKGPDNDWKIDERGACGAYNHDGVYLAANGIETCKFLWNVPDEDVVAAVFSPKMSNINDSADQGYPHYDAESVLNDTQFWNVNDVAYNETTHDLYLCKNEWCNQSPAHYAPGVGRYWQQAWDLYK